jgi:hypothetical protein
VGVGGVYARPTFFKWQDAECLAPGGGCRNSVCECDLQVGARMDV